MASLSSGGRLEEPESRVDSFWQIVTLTGTTTDSRGRQTPKKAKNITPTVARAFLASIEDLATAAFQVESKTMGKPYFPDVVTLLRPGTTG
jgi:hypothetical protein